MKKRNLLYVEPLSLVNIVPPSLHTKQKESCLYDFVSLTFKLDEFSILRETQNVSFTIKEEISTFFRKRKTRSTRRMRGLVDCV